MMSKPVTEIILTDEVLKAETVISAISHAKCGAISLFIGTTRDNHDGKRVIKLEYECYKKMAEKEIEKICLSTRKQWPDVRNIAVHHRLGHVPVMDASIIIGVSAPHRKDAMAASQYCINSLKASVPIWKKEVYSDGSEEWQENEECSWSKS